jgi:hypothetical protein
MPFKANADRRHHIPKQKRKVTNWAAYDASLRQRGSLTVWFMEEAIVAWRAAPRTTRGGIADPRPRPSPVRFSPIDRSKAVICDCPNRNSNVFYEIGIAHTLGREVILITQIDADIPT